MQFATPWMLLGLALCAVPIVIHLFHRRRYRREPWAAMRFLRAALQQRSRQLQIESLLLLVLRTLLVVLLVLAAAEPLFYAAESGWRQREGVHRILVLDVSASLGTRVAGQTSYQKALGEIERLLAGAASGDAWRLVRIAATPPRGIIRRETFDSAEVRTELSRVPLTEERGDVATSLQQVADLLAETARGEPQEVVIFTDLQQNNWLPDEPSARERMRRLLQQIAKRASLRVIDVGSRVDGNVGIVELRSARPIVAPQQTVTLTAVVRNFGRTPVATMVEWRRGGRVEEIIPVEVPPESEKSIDWTVRVEDSLALEVEARLATEDPLPLDDRRFLAVPVREFLRVLLVDGRPSLRRAEGATGYLRLALAPPAVTGAGGGAPRRMPVQPEVIADVDLATADLERFDCVWLCDVPRVGRDDARRLAGYVTSGGGLILSPGDQVDLASYREELGAEDRALLPARLDAIVDAGTDGPLATFEPTSPPHPIVRPFEGNPDAGLLTTLVNRYVRADLPDAGTVRVAVRFSTGDPAIVEQQVGSGRVVLVLTSVDDRWGNWAVWPSFLPLVHELALFASSGAAAASDVLVGDAITRLVPPAPAESSAAMVLPQERRVELVPQCDAEACRLRFTETATAGFYRLELGPPPGRRETIAVNVDPAESTPARLDEVSLARELLGGMKFEYATQWMEAAGGRESTGSRGSFAGPLLVAALLVLLVEQLLAWRFAWGVATLIGVVWLTAVYQIGRESIWGSAALVLTTLAAAAVILRRWRGRSKTRSSGW